MPSRMAKVSAGGRPLSTKAGGEAGVHGKMNASQHDEDQMQVCMMKHHFLETRSVDILLSVLYNSNKSPPIAAMNQPHDRVFHHIRSMVYCNA